MADEIVQEPMSVKQQHEEQTNPLELIEPVVHDNSSQQEEVGEQKEIENYPKVVEQQQEENENPNINLPRGSESPQESDNQKDENKSSSQEEEPNVQLQHFDLKKNFCL